MQSRQQWRVRRTPASGDGSRLDRRQGWPLAIAVVRIKGLIFKVLQALPGR